MIHPFLDGNGRVGRMLVPLFLYSEGLLSAPTFYISAYFEKNRDEYYEHLRSISRENDWEAWIKFFLTAINDQAVDNFKRVSEIFALRQEMKQVLPELTKSQHAVQAIDALFSNPFLTISVFCGRSGIPKHAALRIIKLLKGQGIIEEISPSRGAAQPVLVFPKLLEITER